ncbi:YybH family protein [Longitalea luteola]|uniref:YybH family protein n=1 Tax=Longitalea luteola TaxID=2812563 RepID=UPI001A962F86|nr:hypothetical protein [Longitalea luteola]
MKLCLPGLLIFILSFCPLKPYAQTRSSVSPAATMARADDLKSVKAELEALNNKIGAFYRKEAADSMLTLYANNFTFLPEYKPAIVERTALQQFFKDWFQQVSNLDYKKAIYKVEIFDDYILEIGTFRLGYSTDRNVTGNYTGKYMIMWKRNSASQLSMLSEAFGSDRNIGPADVPYANVVVKENFVLDKNILSTELAKDIEAADKMVVQAVEQGNGQLRAEGFTKDGIYMPHFGTILEGMDALIPYMKRIYVPEAKLYSKNTYREIFHTGEYVFLHGHFKGGWGDPVNGGKFEGNMSNLMKKNKKGELLMYRQLANNDR